MPPPLPDDAYPRVILAVLAPCRDCGREKPVNTWCTATEECQAHTDAALEAEEQRREAGK